MIKGPLDRFKDAAGAALVASRNALLLRSPHHRAVASRAARKSPLMLNVGCGSVKFDGWINMDIEPGGDLMWDLRKGLPFPDGSVDIIYNEHFIEHIPHEAGLAFCREAHRAMKKGGVLRIATPDLDHLVAKYSATDWRDQNWLTWPEYQFIQSRAMMMNVSMRWWGHEFVYNEEELRLQLGNAGFRTIRRVTMGESDLPALRGRETRPDSFLVVEAVKE